MENILTARTKSELNRIARRALVFSASALFLAVPALCQSEKPANNVAEGSCQFEIKQLGRAAGTSQELIQLEAKLLEPDVPVTQRLITQLANLSATDADLVPSGPALAVPDWRLADRPYAKKYQEAIGKYLDVLVRVLPEKTGEAQSESFVTAVQNQFLRSLPMAAPVQTCLQKAAIEIFPNLSFQKQWSILFSCESCKLFRSATLTSYWENLYEDLETHLEETPPDELERSLRFCRTGILKRIYDADPALGRKMILHEIASPQPRCDIDALRLLPDETLPAMDALFAQQLQGIYEDSDWSEYQTKLAVIERYATATILPEMKVLYSNDPDQRNQYHLPLFLSYFLRAEPAYGKKLIEEHLKGPRRDNTLLTNISEVREQPTLEELARQHLSDPDKAVAANAAHVLRYGRSQSDEALLWQYLESWHKQWSDKKDPIPFNEQNYEDGLVEALLFGSGPCKTRDTLDRLRALYIKGQSVDGNIELPDWHSPIRMMLQGLSNGIPKFAMDFCSGSLALDELKTAIPRFPKGTEFEWYGTWDPILDEKSESLRVEIKRYAEGLGMSLQPHALE